MSGCTFPGCLTPDNPTGLYHSPPSPVPTQSLHPFHPYAPAQPTASVPGLVTAARAVLEELDIIRGAWDRQPMFVHIDTHNDLRAALAAEAADG